jgi:stress response protein YsnF
VVKEMLVIRKRTVQDTQVVEADVRRERVDVERRDARGDVEGEPPGARGE